MCDDRITDSIQKDMYDTMIDITKEMLSCIQAQEDILSSHATRISEKSQEILQAYLDCQEASYRQVLSDMKAATKNALKA